MKRKIILFRLRSMEMGGVQKVLIDILQRLDKDQYDLHLLLNLYQGELLHDIPSTVKIHYLAKGKEYFSANRVLNFIQLVFRRIILMFYFTFPIILMRKLSFVPDIEIAFMSANLPELIKSPFKKSKKINWFHSDIRFFPKKIAHRLIMLMNKSDITIFVSQTTQKNVEAYSKYSVSNGICIYNLFDYKSILLKAEQPIDNKIFKKSGKTFVSVGRLDYAKGYDLLLQAHAELIREGFMHTIIIIGSGYFYQKLKETIAYENIKSTFILAGQKENPYPYIKSADFYIQPSRYEAYPLSIGEALILNKPIICTDCGGVKEMISHKETGYIINFSKEEMKEAIKTFLSDSSLIRQIENNQQYLDFEIHNTQSLKKIENIFSQTKIFKQSTQL